MQWLLILSSLAGLWVLSNVWSLVTNYLTARKSSFPISVAPTNPSNFLWMVLCVPLRPILSNFLPAAIWESMRKSVYGWEYADRYVTHKRLGQSFMLVTPGKNELWVAEPELANAILVQRKDFHQSELTALIVGLFGQNLITLNGDDWQRHRKLVAPNLNERISGLVWTESCHQAREMLDYYMNRLNGETDKTLEGLRLIAMHVLGSAGYGVSQPWDQGVPKPGQEWSYVDAISIVINNIAPAAVLPAFVYSLPFIPESFKMIRRAVREFPVLTKQMLEAERQSATADARARNNMMSTLVRVSDEAKAEKQVDAKSMQYLSEEEILGNLFLFTAAGFDTTANSMAYAITILAAYPQWQEWIFEELDGVLPGDGVSDYARIFPKLIRCLALMYEILRIYPPVLHLTRHNPAHQVVTAASNTYQIPADTLIYINNSALHTNPSIWGDDSLTFRPTRWISQESSSEESLITMPRGTFLPWSGGPRVCPGQKMAHVEFVAVFATIFRRYKCSTVLQDGETAEMARERFEEIMKDSQPRLTLQMNSPESVKLRWSRR